jgi:hypothetical protein
LSVNEHLADKADLKRAEQMALPNEPIYCQKAAYATLGKIDGDGLY